MEKSFIATKESKFTKDMNRYYEMVQSQKDFVNKFCSDNGIEAAVHLVSGSGSVNSPFIERFKSEIALSIDPTSNDKEKFGSLLLKPSSRTGLCKIRKTSKLGKEFAQKCVDEKVIINLFKPMIGDYFRSINIMGASWERFKICEDYYMKVESEYLKADDIPEGFTEIKMSEYYKIRETLTEKG